MTGLRWIESAFEASHADARRRPWSHAIVIGGSISGLLVARVLSERFERVTVLDRDGVPSAAGHRAGVPHDRQVHVLLARGDQLLEKLFPGIGGELVERGAEQLDYAADALICMPGGWLPQQRSGLTVHACSRPLLESVVRARVEKLPNVELRFEHEVSGLLGGAGDGVAGVRVAARGGGPPDELRAQLVVDASGRRSPAPRWLSEIGRPSIKPIVVNPLLGYASRLYRRAPPRAWKLLGVAPRKPDIPRGGVIYPIEGGRWIAMLAGTGGVYPPADAEGFLEFAGTLASPRLRDELARAQPLSPVRSCRTTSNRLYPYASCRAWPNGFIVFGDALCTLNPYYGHGMTSAALQASALGRQLDAIQTQARTHAGPLPARPLQRALERSVRPMWRLATSEDRSWPATEGGARVGVAERVLGRYGARLARKACDDPALARRLLEVSHLMRGPATLLDPRIAWRVLASSTPRSRASP